LSFHIDRKEIGSEISLFIDLKKPERVIPVEALESNPET